MAGIRQTATVSVRILKRISSKQEDSFATSNTPAEPYSSVLERIQVFFFHITTPLPNRVATFVFVHLCKYTFDWLSTNIGIEYVIVFLGLDDVSTHDRITGSSSNPAVTLFFFFSGPNCFGWFFLNAC